MPLILRLIEKEAGFTGSIGSKKGQDEVYTLIGECYLHGVMDGEVFDGEDPPQGRLFTIA